MNRTLRLSILPIGFKDKVVHLSENRSLIDRQSTVYHKILWAKVYLYAQIFTGHHIASLFLKI